MKQIEHSIDCYQSSGISFSIQLVYGETKADSIKLNAGKYYSHSQKGVKIWLYVVFDAHSFVSAYWINGHLVWHAFTHTNKLIRRQTVTYDTESSQT